LAQSGHSTKREVPKVPEADMNFYSTTSSAASEERRRYVQAERFGSLEIDNQLKRCWLLSRQTGGYKKRVSMIAPMPPRGG
jgi:hypothetical protein